MKKLQKHANFFKKTICAIVLLLAMTVLFKLTGTGKVDVIEAEEGYVEVDLSDIDKTYTFENGVSKYGDLESKGWEFTKTGDDYTITIKNLKAKALILPYDVADKGCQDGSFKCGEKPRQSKVTLVVQGDDNKIKGYSGTEYKDGLISNYVKETVITGNGHLVIDSTHGVNLWSEATIESGVTMTINSKVYGISCNHTLNINGGVYKIVAGDSSIIAADGLNISNHAKIDAEMLGEIDSKFAANKGVIESVGGIKIENSKLNIRKGRSAIAGSNVTINSSAIKNDGKLGSEYGISANGLYKDGNGKLTISNSYINLISTLDTLKATGDLSINGGTYKLESKSRKVAVIDAAADKMVIDGNAKLVLTGIGNGVVNRREGGSLLFGKDTNTYISIKGRTVANDKDVDGYAVFGNNVTIQNGAKFEALGPKVVFSKRVNLENGSYYIEAARTAEQLPSLRFPEKMTGDYFRTFSSTYRYMKIVYVEDNEPPKISGYEKGKVYCSMPIITVTDNIGVSEVTVNDVKIRDFKKDTGTLKEFVMPLVDSPIKTIVVTDPVGNKTTETLTAYNGCATDINKTRITVGATSYTYDGKAKKPTVTVYYGTRKLKENADYTVTYKNNVEVGTATVEITGKIGFSGTVVREFKIVKADNIITAQNITKNYSQNAQIASINASSLGNAKLTYSSNNSGVSVDGNGKVTVKAGYTGAATITVTANETADYKKTTKSVVVNVNKLSNQITASNVTKTYSGSNQTFGLGAKQTGNAKLNYSSNNSNVTVDHNGNVTIKKGYVGKATITISADSNEAYNSAYKQVTVTVNKRNNSITASNFTKTYNKKDQSFSIGAKRNDNAKLTYKSNNKNITVNSSGKVTIKKGYIGKATITITANATTGYNKATKNITVTVNPPKVNISKLTNAKGKKMTVKWSKNTAVTGYQIQYSTDKNFKKDVKSVTVKKNGTTSVNISKLTKNKKYYVRMRTYKTVSKVNYYSSWSSVKNVKISK